jgi:hypothetical protein
VSTFLVSPYAGILSSSIFDSSLDQQVSRAWSATSMDEWIQSSIESIGNTIKHIQLTSMNSKANQDYAARLQSPQELASRSRQSDVDYAQFPLQVLPKTRIQTFYGREAQIDEIDAYLGNQQLDRLRTFTIYGRRGVGKTQIALEFAYRHTSKFEAVFWVSSFSCYILFGLPTWHTLIKKDSLRGQCISPTELCGSCCCARIAWSRSCSQF